MKYQTCNVRRHSLRGFTMIELLVAIAINMVLVVAATYLYLGSSESRKVQTDIQQMNENGQFALDVIGRDLINAGFYPMIMQNQPDITTQGIQTTTIVLHGLYFNAVATGTNTYPAFDQGVFGCNSQRFNTTPGQYNCVDHPSSAVSADTLIVNYFTADALGQNVGSRLDCARSNVAAAPENLVRAGTGKTDTVGLQPNAPLFVSNRYTLLPMNSSIEGRTLTTTGLSCAGNGDTQYRPLVSGIEDLQIRYGVYTDVTTLQASQFYSASEMAGVTPLNVGTGILNAWSRVVSVEVCLVARGLMGSKLRESDGTIASYTDCSGALIAPADTDTRKLFRKTFAVRNNLTFTVIPRV
jgi:type IV pilus assembly protein PilW